MNKLTITACVLLMLALSVVSATLKKTRLENSRLSNNQTALLEDVRYYRTSDSLSAASVQKLTLSVAEVKKYREELEQTVSKLNLKIKDLQSVSNTTVETKYVIQTVIKDSIIYRDGQIDSLQCIDHKTKWYTLEGCAYNGKFLGTVQSRDSLTTIVHRVPRKFLFIRIGTKGVRQDVISANLDSKITYTEYLEFKKR